MREREKRLINLPRELQSPASSATSSQKNNLLMKQNHAPANAAAAAAASTISAVMDQRLRVCRVHNL